MVYYDNYLYNNGINSKMTFPQITAYNLGFHAYEQNKSKKDNPYNGYKEFELWLYWRIGWNNHSTYDAYFKGIL